MSVDTKTKKAKLFDKVIDGFLLTLACEHQTMSHYNCWKLHQNYLSENPQVWCDECQQYSQVVDLKECKFRVVSVADLDSNDDDDLSVYDGR